MRNVAPPSRPRLGDYDTGTAATERQDDRDCLSARRDAVGALHDAYAKAGGRPHLVKQSDDWDSKEVAALLALYDMTQKGRPLASLRGAVLKAAGPRCLLCGAARPGSLDHVLPKTTDPALAVLHLNLVGACDPCNRRKSTTRHADQARQFIHPYLDRLPADLVYLVCDPVRDGSLAPQYRIVVPRGMDPELGQRVAWQFERLALDEFYVNEAMHYCNEQALNWLDLLDFGWEELADALQRDLRSVTRAYGVNTWKAALLRGLLGSLQFPAMAAEILARLGSAPLEDDEPEDASAALS